jgi:glycosyltransferase involved in cell wall biosynthesis
MVAEVDRGPSRFGGMALAPSGRSPPGPVTMGVMLERRPSATRRLRIGLMGTRGIPANYGGFETFYDNLGVRLAARGHDVTAYNRPHGVKEPRRRRYGGVRLVPLPSVRTKHLDTITHTALSVLHGLTQQYDIVYICGVGNAPVGWVPRLAGAKVVFNVDSADWKREKWGSVASRYLRATERMAGWVANIVIADNDTIRQRYDDAYGTDAVFIPYGANTGKVETRAALEQYGLTPGRYLLWVGRLEPETTIEDLFAAFARIDDPTLALVIVGDAPYADQFKERLRRIAPDRVLFAGYVYGDAYRELGSHALAYVQTSPTSGTSPAVLDQMGMANAVIVRGTPSNLEVIGDTGLSYEPEHAVDGLERALRRLLDDPDLRSTLGRAAEQRVLDRYGWDAIVDRYEALFSRLADRTGADA